MRKLFGFLNESNNKGIKTVVSTFVSKYPIWDDKNLAIDVEYINSYDREEIANKFIEKRDVFSGYTPIDNVSEEEAKQDLIEYIDFVIPRYYYINREIGKGTKKNREQIRRSYSGIEDLDGIIFTIEDNYERERQLLEEKNAIIPLSIKEYNDLNYPYKKFTDSQLKEMLFNDCYENKMVLVPEKADKLKRIEMLRLLHYFYKNREFEGKDRYIMTIEDYIRKYDKSIEQCFIGNKIQKGDFVTYVCKKTEIDIFGCYEFELVEIGQVYAYNETNDEWKVDWRDLGVSEWEYAGSLKVLNPNIEPVKSIIKSMFKDSLHENYYYEEDEEITIGRYVFKRENEYLYKNGNIYNNKNKPVKFKLEHDLNAYKIYSCLKSESDSKHKLRLYYLVDMTDNNHPIYFLNSVINKEKNPLISYVKKEIDCINRSKEYKLLEEQERLKTEELIEFFYDESYDEYSKRRYPTIKQLYFIGALLDDIYKQTFKKSPYENHFYKFKPTGKFYLKPSISFKNLGEYYEVDRFIKELKSIMHDSMSKKVEFLYKYFEIN